MNSGYPLVRYTAFDFTISLREKPFVRPDSLEYQFTLHSQLPVSSIIQSIMADMDTIIILQRIISRYRNAYQDTQTEDPVTQRGEQDDIFQRSPGNDQRISNKSGRRRGRRKTKSKSSTSTEVNK